MTVPEYTESKEDLIQAMRATAGSGSRQFDIAKAILDIKTQEEVATQTKGLMRATWMLVATTGLLLATLTLVLVNIY